LTGEKREANGEDAMTASDRRDREWRMQCDAWRKRAESAAAGRDAAIAVLRQCKEAMEHVRAHAHYGPETARIIDAALAKEEGK
jgi:hypothetical protein